jgi:hypothetical protein
VQAPCQEEVLDGQVVDGQVVEHHLVEMEVMEVGVMVPSEEDAEDLMKRRRKRHRHLHHQTNKDKQYPQVYLLDHHLL